MAHINSENARIFGGDEDFVAIGDVGAGAALAAALPVTLPTEAPEGFEDAGWLGEDGINLAPDDSVDKFKGHQGGGVVRTKVTSSETSFKFQCLETTALTLGLFLDPKEVKTEGKKTVRKLGTRKVIAKSFVVGLYDEGHVQWYIIDRGEIGERSEVTMANSDITAYEFIVNVIGDWWEVDEDQTEDEESGE